MMVYRRIYKKRKNFKFDASISKKRISSRPVKWQILFSSMDTIITEIENTQYADNVKYAVRYGYQYRREAERNVNFHNCLSDASTILYRLADLVITGVTFDIIKKYAKELWVKLMSMKIKIPEDVNALLIDEDELKRFVVYVNEFSTKNLTATDAQQKYIREEIMADYVGETAAEIWKKKKRQPTHEEWVTIYRDAVKLADDLLLD